MSLGPQPRSVTPPALKPAAILLGLMAAIDFGFRLANCVGTEAGPRFWLDLVIYAALSGLPAWLGWLLFRHGIAGMAERLARRGDTEHGQAALRIALGSFALIHMSILQRNGAGPDIDKAVYVAAIGVALSWAILLHIVVTMNRRRWRRIAANVLDLANLSMFLALGGEDTAIWYPVYLWVTFGNGLRYDARSLFFSGLLSVLGFGIVVAVTPYWSSQPILSAGLLIALIVLPAYLVSLIRSLMAAKAQAEAANEAKGRFLAMMSHEVRTPLNSVIGFTQLLERTNVTPEQADMLGMVRNSARTLLALISDILDLAKIEVGRTLDEVEDFDLWETVRTGAFLLHPQASSKGLDLVVRIDGRTPRHLHGMSVSLRQIIVNLVGNAVKFTERGRIEVSVEPVLLGGWPGESLRTGVQITVADQGIGIPVEMRERIFEPFTQADEGITRRYGGTGLGLAIVKSLSESMGGKVTVESSPGEGSRFTVSVPVNRRPSRALPVATLRLAGDSPATLDQLKTLLANAGPRILLGEADSTESEHALIEASGRAADSLLPKTLHFTTTGARSDFRSWEARVVLEAPYTADQVLRTAAEIMSNAATDARQDVAAIAVAPGTTPSMKPLTLLVADDNETNRLMLGRMLELEGHKVRFAVDGEEAVDAVEAGGIDAVIMDINMPRMSGLEATRMIRFLRMGDARALPIVALTADATVATARRCREAGMDDLITKPVEPAALMALLARLCGGAHTGPAAASPAAAMTLPKNAAKAQKREAAALAVPAAAVVADPASQPVLDAAMMRTLAEEPEFLGKLQAAFRTDSERAIGAMRRSLATHDAAQFRDAAHSLRSAAANLGALRLAQLTAPLKTWGADDLEKGGADALQGIIDARAVLLAALEGLSVRAA